MKKLSGLAIMIRLIWELKPLIPFMVITVFMGVLGYLSAISIFMFASAAAVSTLGNSLIVSFNTAIIAMIVSAIVRGPFKYLEQLSGHYIAFKILVILRDKVFKALRRLAPAKVEGKEKGNLVSLITSDIELLEVFYAHTVAPVLIAVITSFIAAVILWLMHPLLGFIAAVFYFMVGFVIPYVTSSFAKKAGIEYRDIFGKCSSHLLDSLRGISDILTYKNGEKRAEEIHSFSEALNHKQFRIKQHEGIIKASVNFVIMLSIIVFLFLGIFLVNKAELSIGEMIVAVVLIASSFGPTAALSNVSNNLLLTFAAAQRLFDILDEQPAVEEVAGDTDMKGFDVVYNNVSFGYDEVNQLLRNTNLKINAGDKLFITGDSGIGKSTFAKLLMRFFDVNNGEITFGNESLKQIPTKTLRRNQVFMSQETFLFNATIFDNIKLAEPTANKQQVIEAAKKASIHEFIEKLPKGYDTKLAELGSNLSSGEKQRIGLARCFLKNAPVMILDEPTSNLDTLNEGVILKALRENAEDNTVLFITHRKSALSMADKVFRLKDKTLVRQQ